MNFIKELQESRMTRDARNQRLLTYTDCKEKAYLTILCLQAMRYYRKHKTDAMKYAYKTVMFREYNRFRIDSTDLYNLYHFITGDEKALKKLRNPGAAAKERRTTVISVGKLNGFLRRMASGDSVTAEDIKALALIESDLDISNPHYREIRRRLNTFDTDTTSERKTTITRLLFAARSKLSDSDVMPMFSKFAGDNNLEDFSATDPEPKISTPDQMGMADVQMYRLLLPVNSLPFVSRFLNMISKGKTIPANIAASYYPLVMMVHDIVKAGPAYIDQLKILHNRAKKARK
tara:strand:- start:6570 stop:7439 length:870 start_codon:yes stop_codon:yes gene_type:complete